MKQKVEKLAAEELVLEMVLIHRRLMPRIGGKKLYWMIKPDINQMGIRLGRDQFFDLLRANGLLVDRKQQFARTTDSYHRFHVHRNLLKEKLISKPNQAVVSDITYLRVRGKKFVYLFLITDAYSRKIVGWDLSDSLAIEGAIKALKMALKQCPDPIGLIHHSDRGIQYCSKDYVKILKKRKALISMTEQNHCYENAMAERVNGILKDEFMLDAEFCSQDQALKAVKQAISTYNTYRPHMALRLSTPQQIHQAA
jgi:putative transposase